MVGVRLKQLEIYFDDNLNLLTASSTYAAFHASLSDSDNRFIHPAGLNIVLMARRCVLKTTTGGEIGVRRRSVSSYMSASRHAKDGCIAAEMEDLG